MEQRIPIDERMPINERCNADGKITKNAVLNFISESRKNIPNSVDRDNVMNIIRLFTHVSEVEIPNMIPSYVKECPIDPNRILRIQYMISEIDKEQFKIILQNRQKDTQKRENLLQIWTTFIDVTNDFLRNIIDTTKHSKEISTYLKEMEQFRNYINKSLQQVAEQYKTKKIYITENFIIETI